VAAASVAGWGTERWDAEGAGDEGAKGKAAHSARDIAGKEDGGGSEARGEGDEAGTEFTGGDAQAEDRREPVAAVGVGAVCPHRILQ